MIQHILPQAVNQARRCHVLEILGSRIQVNGMKLYVGKRPKPFSEVLGLGTLCRGCKAMQKQDRLLCHSCSSSLHHPSDNSTLLKSCHISGRIVQQLPQHLLCVLAQLRRRTAHAGLRLRQLIGKTGESDRAR